MTYLLILFIAAIILITRWVHAPIKRKTKSVHRVSLPLSHIYTGSRCNLCGEPYVGLAMDCRCTNYGK